jgi:hypothetical protein
LKHLTDEAAQVAINLLLNVRYTEVGSNGLKNAAAVITQLEAAEEVKPELKEIKKKA